MLLCHCKGVNDAVISCAISCGAHTADAVADACGAGSRCGGCRPAIDALLDQHLVGRAVSAARSA